MALCKFCKEPIAFVKEGGRWMPVNPGETTRHACKLPQAEGQQEAQQSEADYSNMSRLELQRVANERELRPDGTAGAGFSTWRAGASKSALLAALLANDGGCTVNDGGCTVTVDPADNSKPDAAPSDLAAAIAAAVGPLVKGTLDSDAVRSIVREELADGGHAAGAVTVTVVNPSGEARDMGRQHPQFPLLVKLLGRRKNVWLAGPAGSGKTTAAHKASEALGLAFGSMSIGPQTTQSAIFGYMDAGGTYRETEFRRRYQAGGVFLLDEIDRGNPGVLTALNQAIENGMCAFPDGMVARHPDFTLVACANTFGRGASRDYVGALQLDAATLDRFMFVAWEYDDGLETDLARAAAVAAGGTAANADKWITYVRKMRAQCLALKLRHIVSPRASIHGAELLAAGIDGADVVAMLVTKGLDADTITKLEGR